MTISLKTLCRFLLFSNQVHFLVFLLKNLLLFVGPFLFYLFWGKIRVGRIYQQTFVDTCSKVAFCKLYTTKTPITSADLLNDRVLPFFEEQEVPLLRVLTDRGTEVPLFSRTVNLL